jgi:hypothetical protein
MQRCRLAMLLPPTRLLMLGLVVLDGTRLAPVRPTSPLLCARLDAEVPCEATQRCMHSGSDWGMWGMQ